MRGHRRLGAVGSGDRPEFHAERSTKFTRTDQSPREELSRD
jgi:hypothetical protein